MPINPHADETQSEWMSRCVPEMIGTGSDKRPREQAVAACLQLWRDRNKKDFCQDPDTGLLCGSDPSGGSDTSSGGGKGGGKPGGGKGSAKVDSLGKFREDKVKVAVTSGENEKEFLEVWNSKIGMEPAAFKKDFLGGADGEMTLSLRGGGSIAGPANRWLEITGKIKDGGKTVGDFHRLIDVQKNSAESAMFEMNKEAQGKGFGKKLLAGNIAMYREMGLKKVETLANIDVGGYAWAKYGYVPTRSAWSALKSEWSKGIANSPPDTQARFKAEVAPLLSSDPKAIWAIADSKWGKTLLLGRSWEGVLNLKDKESMGRFDAYVSKKSASKSFRVVRADPPNGSKDPKSKEFFYIDDDGTAQDADLHNDILDEGDDEAAKEISDAVKARILGEKAMPKTKQAPQPDDDESESDFMDRCIGDLTGEGMDESDAEEACSIAWDERKATTIVAKTHAGDVNGMHFILSDESADRMGDVILSTGWQIENYKRNPIALFGHNPNFPIGKWNNLRVEGTELRGQLELAPEGTSPRIDEIRRLIEAGILKAVSVGFRPIKYEPLNKETMKGIRFLEHELVETSLVSVPANPNALAVAKGLDVSADTLAMVFAGQGTRKPGLTPRRSTGGQADTSPIRIKAMNSLAQNIQEAQGQLSVLRDALQEHLQGLDNDNVTDAQMQKTDDFHQRIAKKKKLLDQFVESEKALGNTTASNGNGHDDTAHEIRMPTRRVDPPTNGTRVYPEIKKAYVPGDLTFKALTCMVRMQNDKYRKSSPLEVIRDSFGEDDKVRAVFDALVGKAATVPALTTTVGWAAELVRTDIQGFMESLTPASVLARLVPKGLGFSFGTNGIISIPMRAPTPTIAGSFVGEGAPIPVRQGAFQAITLIPKKLAVISVFSREISEHSTPAIEGLLRSAIVDDTAVAVDSVLLDANAATAVRPAGLRNGVSSLTPTAGANFAAVVGDIKLLAGALLTSTLGNVRAPVWLMPPNLVLALRLTVAPNGTLVFAEEISRGSFMGWPVIESPNVTADTMYLIDAADFVSAMGEPRFDVSDAATVHMEDTTPLAIGSAGTPASVAAPTRSFWQTDTLGIRMIMPANWSFRRSGMVAYISAVTWK